MQLTYGENDAHSDERLGELILYVADKCADDPRFGATKLNKILWWSDFQALQSMESQSLELSISACLMGLSQGVSSRFGEA